MITFPARDARQRQAPPRPGSVTRPIDVATLELLERWQREDAVEDPAQIQAAEAEVGSTGPDKRLHTSGILRFCLFFLGLDTSVVTTQRSFAAMP